jgi:hypothetical protein
MLALFLDLFQHQAYADASLINANGLHSVAEGSAGAGLGQN